MISRSVSKIAETPFRKAFLGRILEFCYHLAFSYVFSVLLTQMGKRFFKNKMCKESFMKLRSFSLIGGLFGLLTSRAELTTMPFTLEEDEEDE